MIIETLGRRSGYFLPLALALLALSLLFSLRLWQKFGNLTSSVRVGTDVLEHTERLLIALSDAETGQRGFLLTGRNEYLQPYESGAKQAPEELTSLRQAALPFPEQRLRVEAIGPLMSEKLSELRLTIYLLKTSGVDTALAVVNSDEGKRSMDSIRNLCGQIKIFAQVQLARDELAAEESLRQGIAVTTAGSVLVFVLLTAALRVIGRANRERDRLIRELHERGRLLENFQLPMEASPSAMIMVGSDGLITLINGQTEKLLGYGRRELLGRHVEMLIPERFRANHEGHCTGFFTAPATRSMGQGRDLFVLRADRSEVPVEISLNPMFTADGQFVLASIIDITQRKRCEAELQSKAAEMERFTNTVSHDLKSPLITINSCLIGASNEGMETNYFVKANGVGVDPKHHEWIFGLFDKLDAKSEGSGAGSTFWFSLKDA